MENEGCRGKVEEEMSWSEMHVGVYVCVSEMEFKIEKDQGTERQTPFESTTS